MERPELAAPGTLPNVKDPAQLPVPLVRIPEEYLATDQDIWGLLIHHSDNHAAAISSFAQLQAKQQLLVIGFSHAAELSVDERSALTLDAVHQAQQNYRIDPQRVYVSGWMKGGLVSSSLLSLFPQVFSGGIVGAQFAPLAQTTQKSEAPDMQKSRKRQRFYGLLTQQKKKGIAFEADKLISAYQKLSFADFKQVTLSQKGRGKKNAHPQDAFHKAIVWLDEWLNKEAQQQMANIEALITQEKIAEAYLIASDIAYRPIFGSLDQEARAYVTDLTERAEEAFTYQFLQMKLHDTPSDIYRWADRISEFAVAAEAKTFAQAGAHNHLQRILRSSRSRQVALLTTFLTDWQSDWDDQWQSESGEPYRIRQAAVDAYNSFAEQHFTRAKETREAYLRAKNLSEFIEQWSHASARDEAKAMISDALDELIENAQDARNTRTKKTNLSKITRHWPDTPQGKRAQSMLKGCDFFMFHKIIFMGRNLGPSRVRAS